MDHSELVRLATVARQRKAEQRAETLRRHLEQGVGLKRAAFNAGMAERTARDWRIKLGLR